MNDPFIVDSALEWELGKNAAAKAAYEAMEPEARERFRSRVSGARTRAEVREAVNALVGWQRGHGPYQL